MELVLLSISTSPRFPFSFSFIYKVGFEWIERNKRCSQATDENTALSFFFIITVIVVVEGKER